MFSSSEWTLLAITYLLKTLFVVVAVKTVPGLGNHESRVRFDIIRRDWRRTAGSEHETLIVATTPDSLVDSPCHVIDNYYIILHYIINNTNLLIIRLSVEAIVDPHWIKLFFYVHRAHCWRRRARVSRNLGGQATRSTRWATQPRTRTTIDHRQFRPGESIHQLVDKPSPIRPLPTPISLTALCAQRRNPLSCRILRCFL